MVSFQCGACGDVVKKPKAADHMGRCRSVVACVDCGQEFDRWSVAAHTQCMTEVERYGGESKKPGFVPGARQPSAGAGGGAKPKFQVIQPDPAALRGPPWNCALCKTHTTSREMLLLHVSGKKHQAKARAQARREAEAGGGAADAEAEGPAAGRTGADGAGSQEAREAEGGGEAREARERERKRRRDAEEESGSEEDEARRKEKAARHLERFKAKQERRAAEEAAKNERRVAQGKEPRVKPTTSKNFNKKRERDMSEAARSDPRNFPKWRKFLMEALRETPKGLRDDAYFDRVRVVSTAIGKMDAEGARAAFEAEVEGLLKRGKLYRKGSKLRLAAGKGERTPLKEEE